MIHILRASHANEFELQNYKGTKNITVITSHHPLTPISLPHTKLWSPTDLPNFPFRRQLCNRLFGGEQWLLGLENYLLSKRHNELIPPCREAGHDVINTAETYTPYTHQAVQLRKRGVIGKLVCTCWETIPHNNEKFARLRQWKQEAYQYVDLFHTPTERAKQALITEGVDPAKIKVIPYGVDLSRFHPSPAGALAKEGRLPLILTVARPVPEKGVDIFHQLARELKDIADFRLVSHATYAQMPNIYRSSDIFLLPSQTTSTWEEQYGMVLVEAMATGLPIITTTCGAIREVVGKAGITLQECDIQGIISALQSLIHSPALRAKYAHLSLTRARALYDCRKIALQLAQLYC